MESQDLERIARVALRELGAGDPPIHITPDVQSDRWRVQVGGNDPLTLIIRAGSGTTPNFVREQIFTQFSSR
ncbi:MAG TPA: hypothetical protein VEL51_24460 [Vicinamibacterales bacterium]|nr:hypothetical protein [Vicinamibacterales bacterium]